MKTEKEVQHMLNIGCCFKYSDKLPVKSYGFLEEWHREYVVCEQHGYSIFVGLRGRGIVLGYISLSTFTKDYNKGLWVKLKN